MEQLANRLARGDETAFAELYDLCAARIHRYLVLRLGNREDAADVLQESFLRLVRAREQLADVQSAFAFAIARNESARFRGRQTRQRDNRFVHEKAAGLEPSVGLEAVESASAVQEALLGLSDEQREVVVLKIYGELTFREMAEATSLPQGTLATRYRAAMERLQSLLAKERL